MNSTKNGIRNTKQNGGKKKTVWTPKRILILVGAVVLALILVVLPLLQTL